MDLEKLQKNIGYSFKDLSLLKKALVHRSYLNEKNKDPEITQHNERLEFLGDAVLEISVTEYLFTHSDQPEGYLTSLRAALVNYKIMGKVGQSIGLENQILLSKGEREEFGKARLSIVADTMEAVLGAMYLDGGMTVCDHFIREHILIYLPEIIDNKSYKDKKTSLQEYTQKVFKQTPHYKVLFSEGKDHDKTFHVGIWVAKKKIAEASGRSKQAAEVEAAKIALDIFQENQEEQEVQT